MSRSLQQIKIVKGRSKDKLTMAPPGHTRFDSAFCSNYPPSLYTLLVPIQCFLLAISQRFQEFPRVSRAHQPTLWSVQVDRKRGDIQSLCRFGHGQSVHQTSCQTLYYQAYETFPNQQSLFVRHCCLDSTRISSLLSSKM